MSESRKTIAGLFAGIYPPDPDLVWRKGIPIPGYDPAVWRRDEYGNAMRRADHGNRASRYGWEIDHILPRALGGGDGIANLRPLHHRTNARMGGLLGTLLD